MDGTQDLRTAPARPDGASRAPDLRASVVIVGGGAAGITVAAGLRRHRPDLDGVLIKSSATHSHQRGWTLMEAGVFTPERTIRPEASLIALAALDGREPAVRHEGYGSCPLTVAHGKVVLAEFSDGDKVTPSFRMDPRRPRTFAWPLKIRALPVPYWNMTPRGSELDVPHRERSVRDAA